MTPLAELGEAAWTAIDVEPVLVDGRSRPRLRRRDLAARAIVLRSRGATAASIAETLRIGRSYAASLFSDPTGSGNDRRRARYAGVCGECGGPTNGSDGRAAAARICGDCAAILQHEERRWTRDEIVRVLRHAAEWLGRTPTTTDASRSPSVRAGLSEARNRELDEIAAAEARGDVRIPHPWIVGREFGSWRAAIRAAGLNPAPQGMAARRNGHYVPRLPTGRPDLDEPRPIPPLRRAEYREALRRIRAAAETSPIPEPPLPFALLVHAELERARGRAASVLRPSRDD